MPFPVPRAITSRSEMAASSCYYSSCENMLLSYEEGDNWRFECKGEVAWGRVVGNGQQEVDRKPHADPRRAIQGLVRDGVDAWDDWHYKDATGNWRRVAELRKIYRERE